jgi:hypothetical protein
VRTRAGVQALILILDNHEFFRQVGVALTTVIPRERTGLMSPARVTLPRDLSGSLKYLDDAQLQRLLEAVTVEIDRRNQGAPKNETATAAATGTSSQGQSATFRKKKTRGIDEFPEGTANQARSRLM